MLKSYFKQDNGIRLQRKIYFSSILFILILIKEKNIKFLD